jgi:hypothetical protein
MHLQRTEPADLEIHEITIGVSLSTRTSSTTESIAPLKRENKDKELIKDYKGQMLLPFDLHSARN